MPAPANPTRTMNAPADLPRQLPLMSTLVMACQTTAVLYRSAGTTDRCSAPGRSR